MQEWKLPSQLVITDRVQGETDTEMILRHERMRRVTAEGDLIELLDDLYRLLPKDNATQAVFNKFLDKTINN